MIGNVILGVLVIFGIAMIFRLFSFVRESDEALGIRKRHREY